MFQKLLISFTIIIIAITGFAKPVDTLIAAKVASNYYKTKLQQYPQQNSNISEISEIVSLVKDVVPMAHVINFSKGGFVIVAADDASRPILGYSFDGSFPTANIPPVVDEWMQFYYMQLEYLKDNNIQPTEKISLEWMELINGEGERFNRDTRTISPLLTTTWDQGARYNELCPQDPAGPGGHVWSGCVATAMSQVMNYWRYPLQGTGSHGYYSDYGYLFADYGASTYDYNQMNYNIGGEYNYEMAELQYHAGIAVDMMYSPSGSGAYSDDAAAALRNYFGYNSSLQLVYKDDYSEDAWADLLMDNLENGWPMYYHGFGSGGHAFNVDGFQGSDYFHFNWGWSGSYNGYFYLSNLNPGGNDFTWGQGAIVNFYPNNNNYPYNCSGVTVLNRHNGTIEDGSGPVANYTGGMECGWLISPEDSVSGLTLYFDKFDLASGDVLNVFDGENSSFPLIGSYTGTTLPAAIPSVSGKLYIEFATLGNQGKGWQAHYNSYLVNYCPGITHYTDPAGSFSDGSGPREYRNSSICKYIIEPDNAATITISFDSFDTEPEFDKVKVYDMISQTLLGEYSGNVLPNDIVIPSGKGYILFVTNNSNSAPGWDISYTSTITGLSGPDKPNINLYCSPNPADEWLRIDLRSKKTEEIKIDLISADGRSRQVFSGDTTTEPIVINTNIADLAPGIYIVRYTSDIESGTQKIIVR